MADDEKNEKPSKVAYLKPIQGARKGKKKEKTTPPKTSSAARPKSKADVFVTDERFKRAMELIQNDMNQALTLSQMANTQFHFLFQFLVESGIIDQAEYERFLNKMLQEMENIREKDNE